MAAAPLTAGQSAFVSRLAADTGLSAGVITAWALAEESGSAAASRQQAGNHDWLNIGYTDAGTYGAGAGVWKDPVAAADATAGWLRGGATIPGYGRASQGVQQILRAAGQSPTAQIGAIQRSGWASSGYPDLPGLYSQYGGGALAPSAAGTPSIPTSGAGGGSSYGGLSGFLLRAALTIALVAAGVALAGIGARGVLGPALEGPRALAGGQSS